MIARKSGLEGDFAGLENFESAAPVGVAGEFQKDRVATGGKLQSGGGSSRPGSAFRRAWRHGDTVELNGGAGRGAGDLQLVGMSTRRARHIRNKTGPRVRSEREAIGGPRQEGETPITYHKVNYLYVE